MRLSAILLLLALASCAQHFTKQEVLGTYVPVGYKNTFDTIQLRQDGVYHRKVFDKSSKLILEMDGKWEIRNDAEIQFYSFYFNLDDDLIKFPELVKDTTRGRSGILEMHNNTIQFCLGYYQGENCYQRVKKE